MAHLTFLQEIQKVRGCNPQATDDSEHKYHHYPNIEYSILGHASRIFMTSKVDVGFIKAYEMSPKLSELQD